MRKNIILLLSILVAFSPVVGQTLTVDLADFKPGDSHSLNYDESLITNIMFKSVNPNGNVKSEFGYEIAYVLEKTLIDPIDIDLSDYVGIGSSAQAPCNQLKALIEAAANYSTQSDFAEEKWKKEHLTKIKEALDAKKCTDPVMRKKAISFLSKSQMTYVPDEVIEIEPGEKLTIYVSRGTGAQSVSWKFTIKGKPVGQWFTHYGFGIATPFEKFPQYFSKENTGDGATGFTVAKKESRGRNLEYLPAVLVSFIPYKRYNKDFFVSLTGGLGANSDNVAVLLGGSLFFWGNLGINVHVVGMNQQVLDGRYNAAGTSQIAQSLDFDQLHNPKFKLHFGVSMSLRLGTNPFKSDK